MMGFIENVGQKHPRHGADLKMGGGGLFDMMRSFILIVFVLVTYLFRSVNTM